MRPRVITAFDPDAADRRQAIADILARGLVRLLAPTPNASFSAGRTSLNLTESASSELAFTPKPSVTVHGT